MWIPEHLVPAASSQVRVALENTNGPSESTLRAEAATAHTVWDYASTCTAVQFGLRHGSASGLSGGPPDDMGGGAPSPSSPLSGRACG